jgi:hypothetical protein
VPLPLDTSLPEKAIEPLISGLPKQIPAPIDVGELMGLLTHETQQHTTWHKSQVSAQALKDNKPLGVAHRHISNLPDLCFKGLITLELGVIVLKAQRPVFIEGECTHPDLWPSLGASTTNFGHPFNGISTA